MSDRYQSLIHTPVGQLLAKNLGLPNPVRLERWTEGAPLVDRHRRRRRRRPARQDRGRDARRASASPRSRTPRPTRSTRAWSSTPPASPPPTELAELQEFFTPLLRSLETCPRIVVLGTPPESTNSAEERVAQRALEGFTRSLGKEVGRGGTVQLVYVVPAADGALASTLAFLLSPKSAYVSGQVVRIGVHGATAVAEEVAGLGRSAGRQGRDRHRREPRHRRADRPGAAPRRRDDPRHRRAPGGQRAPGRDGRARRRPPHARHHQQGRAAADRAARQGEVRGRRHRRAQRRHHPRQAADEHEARHVRLGDRGQPHRSRADHRRAARSRSWSTRTAGSSASPRSPASPATSARPTTPPPRPASSASSTASPTS